MNNLKSDTNIAVWFPCVRANTGSDIFTIRLVEALKKRGIKAGITWLPHYAEFIPWVVRIPKTPSWATHVHINSWLHKRFIPEDLPVVVTSHLCVHDKALLEYKSFLQRLYHNFWIKYCESNNFRLANKITAVSMYTAKQNERHFNIKSIIPIHNWIDNTAFIPADEKPYSRKFKLLYVGNLSKRKGSDLLPEIMLKLGENFELYFTGDKKKFYTHDKLPNNMIALGHISNQKKLIKYYQNSDVLLFPTRGEGLSLSALEAISCGLPIIASDVSSMSEVVDNDLSGFLCEEGNIESFIIAIKRLADEPSKLAIARRQARHKAKLCFFESEQVEKYLKLYKNL